MGWRVTVLAQLDAARASLQVVEREHASAGEDSPSLVYLEAAIANVEAAAAIVLSAASPGDDGAAGACPNCQAPHEKQRDVSGMGGDVSRFLCLECEHEYERQATSE